MNSEPIFLKNGRIIDPLNQIDQQANILIIDGKCRIIDRVDSTSTEVKTVDLAGKWLVPGLIDMHVHLREPGEEYKETIASGAKAGAAGGFTALACMPNTHPPIDTEIAVTHILEKARQCDVRIYPIGAISKKINGDELAEFGEMMRAGAVAFSDDGRPVKNSQLMRRALEYASSYETPIISHSEDLDLSVNGSMNEGDWSTRLGLRGIPRVAEEIAVYRDIALAAYTNRPIHLAHISTRESINLIRRAKKAGCPVTAETAPHYFTLTEEAIGQYNTYAKMNPPLRTANDVEAVIEALQDNTIDVIATDHAPHSDMEKILEFDRAANGIIGLETAVPLSLELVRQGTISPTRFVELLSVNPARILKVPGGSIGNNLPADLTVIDPDRQFTYTRDMVVSKSKNSPFLDQQLTGKAVLTIVAGKIIFNDM